jgi:hypothetical protein
LVEEKPNSGAANSTGKIRRIANDPVGEHVFDFLPVVLSFLLVRKGCLCAFVGMLKNCCNHKKTSSDHASYLLDSGTGGCYAFSGRKTAISSFSGLSKLESSLVVFSFVP